MLAALATNPNVGLYLAVGLISPALIILAWFNWKPDKQGLTYRGLSVIMTVLAFAIIIAGVWFGVTEDNKQKREAQASRQANEEMDHISKVASQRFGDYTLTLVNTSYDYVELTINDKACSVRVKLIYRNIKSENPSFWLSSSSDITQRDDAVLEREVIDGAHLRSMVC